MSERLWFLFAVFTGVVATLGFGLYKAGTHLSQTFEYFLLQCTRSAGQFIGYCLSFENFWKIIALVAFGAAVSYGIYSLAAQIVATAKLRKQLQGKVCSKWGGDINVVLDSRPFALTIGYFKPQVFVSSACVQALSERELSAVLAHEQYHQTKRHPLGLLLLRGIAAVATWLPLVKSWVRYAQTRYELLADRATLQSHRRSDLAQALLKMATPQQYALERVAASGFAATQDRALFLETGDLPTWSFSQKVVATTFISAMLFMTLFNHVVYAEATSGIEQAAIGSAPVACVSPAQGVVDLMSFGNTTLPQSTSDDVMSVE